MADNIIKEFLVSLGFQVDGQEKFDRGLDAATAKAVALGEAMYDVAKQIAEAMARILPDLDQLYWQTQRLGSSAADIKAYGYAISQLGGSAKGASAALENIAEFMKSSPGAAGWLTGRLGVDPRDIGNAQAVARDLAKTFQRMPYFQAKAYASVLGIDPLQLQAMTRDTGAFENQYRQMAQRLGIDLDALTGKSNDVMTRVRELREELSLAFDVAEYKALEWLIPKLEEFSQWVNSIMSGKKLTGISGQIQKIVDDLGELLSALGELAGTPYMQNFADKMLSAVGNVLKGLSALARMVMHVLNGEWGAAATEAYNVASQASGFMDNFADALFGGGSDRFKQEHWGTASGGAPSSGGTTSGGSPSLGAGPTGPGSGNAGNLRNPNGVGFQRFRSQAEGLVNMARQLVTYQKRDDLNTISQILYRYAPPNENDTEGYIRFVSRMTGFARNQALNLSDASQLERLMLAMIRMEQGHDVIGGADLFNLLAHNAGRINTPFAGRGHSVTIHQTNHYTTHGGDARAVVDGVSSQQDQANQRLVASAGVFAY